MGFLNPAATFLGSPNFTPGRPGVPRWVVLHTTVGSLAAANARFQNPTAAASAHYGIGLDGAWYQWVDEADTAWHAGDYRVNQRSIGIEHEDGGDYDAVRPDALYAASSELVAEVCARYDIALQRGDYGAGLEGVIDHRTVYATSCPDALDTDRIIAGASRFGPGGSSITSAMTAEERSFLYRLFNLIFHGVDTDGYPAAPGAIGTGLPPFFKASLDRIEAGIAKLPTSPVAGVDLAAVNSKLDRILAELHTP